MKRLTFIVAALLTLVSFTATAASSPVTMLENIANRTLATVKRKGITERSNPRAVHRIVYRIIIPHVDVTGMSRSVIRREVWKSASKGQKSKFIKEFTKIVVRTYSSALALYSNQQVKFYRIRGGYQGRRRVRVNSVIIRRGASRIPMSYRLISLRGRWKVYDMSVEGVSVLQSFRSQFSSELSRGNFNALINKLVRKNRGR